MTDIQDTVNNKENITDFLNYYGFPNDENKALTPKQEESLNEAYVPDDDLDFSVKDIDFDKLETKIQNENKVIEMKQPKNRGKISGPGVVTLSRKQKMDIDDSNDKKSKNKMDIDDYDKYHRENSKMDIDDSKLSVNHMGKGNEVHQSLLRKINEENRRKELQEKEARDLEEARILEFEYQHDIIGYSNEEDGYSEIEDDDIVDDDMLTHIFELIPIYFHGANCSVHNRNIYIGTNEDNSKSTLQFRLCMYIDNNYHRNLCFYIEHLNKGVFSGPESLERLELLARRVGVKYLMLQDESSKPYQFTRTVAKINLAIISIITRGNSWYNQLGFYQRNYETQKAYWDDLIKSKITFREIIPILKVMTFDQFAAKTLIDWYDDGLDIYCKHNRIKLTRDNFDEVLDIAIQAVSREYEEYLDKPISDSVTLFYLLTKEKNSFTKPKQYIYSYLFFSLCGYIFPYYRYHLVKQL